MRLSRAGKLMVPGWNCFGVRCVPGMKSGRVCVMGVKAALGILGPNPQ